jgi:hypothetical protein
LRPYWVCWNGATARIEPMAIISLRELLRRAMGGDKKPKSAFASEQEAYEFCQRVYKETGGVTPELQRVYDFYRRNINDGCPPVGGHQ